MRPYKASGIRLEQLKSCVDEMVENEILSPRDSDTVSPVFFVTKKQSKDKTAVSGRLVFDYRRTEGGWAPYNRAANRRQWTRKGPGARKIVI